MPVLQEAFREQVWLEKSASPERPLFIGGKSMGGRVASLMVEELAASDGVRGCLCLGYPFHPPGKPLQLRTEHLAALRTPTLILQGERDSFGRREEVETYTLSRRCRWSGSPAATTASNPPAARASARRRTGPRRWRGVISFLRGVLGG